MGLNQTMRLCVIIISNSVQERRITMKTLVVYYSRTGHVKQLADKLAKEKQADIISLEHSKDYLGAGGFVKGGLHALTKKNVSIKPIKTSLSDYEYIYVLTPIWAGSVAPAVRTFTKDYLSQSKGNYTILFSCAKKTCDDYKKKLQKDYPSATVVGFTQNDYSGFNPASL